MTNNQQSSALTPIPSPAVAGEGSIVTEMVVDHFRKIQYAGYQVRSQARGTSLWGRSPTRDQSKLDIRSRLITSNR
jgi:hypothetical protein